MLFYVFKNVFKKVRIEEICINIQIILFLFKIKIMKKYVILNAHTFPETLIFIKNQKNINIFVDTCCIILRGKLSYKCIKRLLI